MSETVVWGCAGVANRVFSAVPGLINYVDRFVDRSKQMFMGRSVRRPESIKKSSDCLIVICLHKKYHNEVYQRLLNEFGIPEQKIMSFENWLLQMLQQHAELKFHPTSIIMDASTLCQLSCTTCHMRRDNYGNKGGGYLKNENFRNFLEKHPDINKIELSSGGEVFMNPELAQIIYSAAEFGVTLSISGCNFNYVSDDTLEAIVKTRCVTSMVMAIDGASQESYVQYRRKGNYDTVISNIRKLNAIKEYYHSDLPVLNWQYVLFAHNEHDVEKAISTAKELNMGIFFKLDWGGTFHPENPEKLAKLTGLNLFNQADYRQETGEKYIQSNICQMMLFTPVINWDGRLYGCCMAYLYDWGINVFQNGLYEAINSKLYREAVYRLLGDSSITEHATPCGKCPIVKDLEKGAKLQLISTVEWA